MSKINPSSILFEGRGVHSNNKSTIKLIANPEKKGIRFHLISNNKNIILPCTIDYLANTSFQINLTKNNLEVKTIEHLLSALYGLGLANMDIYCDSEEIPILDGSALPYVEKLKDLTADKLEYISLNESIIAGDEHRYIIALPSDTLRIHSIIQFSHPLINKQRYDFEWSKEHYIKHIAPARTFGFLSEWEELKANGFALGSNPDNTLIFTDDNIYNPPLRIENEPLKHKILDFIAILSLIPKRVNMELFCFCSGHHLDIEFIKMLNHSIIGNKQESNIRLIDKLIKRDFYSLEEK